MLRPQSRPAGKLQDFARLQFLSERRFNDSEFVEPGGAVCGSTIVAALPQEPFVILVRSGPVVLDLLLENMVAHLVQMLLDLTARLCA